MESTDPSEVTAKEQLALYGDSGVQLARHLPLFLGVMVRAKDSFRSSLRTAYIRLDQNIRWVLEAKEAVSFADIVRSTGASTAEVESELTRWVSKRKVECIRPVWMDERYHETHAPIPSSRHARIFYRWIRPSDPR